MRTGDIVRHKASGETWVLAYADHERGQCSATGWPFTIVPIADVESVRAATDEEYESHVAEWIGIGTPGDLRKSSIERLHPETCARLRAKAAQAAERSDP